MKTSPLSSPILPLTSNEADTRTDDSLSNSARQPVTHSDSTSLAFAGLKPRNSTDSSHSGPRPASSRRHSNAIELANLNRTPSTLTATISGSPVNALPADGLPVAQSPAPADDNELTFELPAPCSGDLTMENGQLRCAQDQGVQGILDLVSELAPTAVRDLDIAPGAIISIGWDEKLEEKMGQFMQLADGNILLATDLLRDAIDKGDHAFTPAARVPGTDQHPSEFLRDIDLHIQVPQDGELAQRLQSAITRQSPDSNGHTRIEKFRNDFGAMSLLSLANTRVLDRQLTYGLGASVAGTGAIGATFDYGIWGAVKSNMSASSAKKFGPLLDSLTPLFAETFDSMVVKRLMEVMKGGNFFPDNLGEATGDLKGAAFSGAIAAVGSIANNYVRDLAEAAKDAGHTKAAIGLLVARQFTNLLANWTSGAMVPLEVMNDHNELVEAKMGLMEKGIVPQPEVDNPEQHVRDSTLNTIRAARGSGSAIRSMATSGEIAATLGLLLSTLEHFGKISRDAEKLFTLMYSTPTEVISMTATLVGEKWIGAGSDKKDARITTEAGKQSAMLARIAGAGDTTLADLDHIARPPGERGAQLGYLVTQGLGGAMGLVDKGSDLGMHYAGTALAHAGEGLSAVLSTLERIPYVKPVLTSAGNGLSGGAQLVFDHALKPVGQGVQHLPGATYGRVLEPTGRGLAWAARMAGPALAPIGNAAMAVSDGFGTQVAKRFFNGTAVGVDALARAPGIVRDAGGKAFLAGVQVGGKVLDQVVATGTDALGRAARARRPHQDNEPTGESMV